MRDVDERDADVVLDRLQLELHLLAELEVERAERLVEQQHLRLVHKRAGERDPLLLTTGELARLALAHPLQADDLQHRLDTPTQRLPAHGLRRSPKATFSNTERCGKSA